MQLLKRQLMKQTVIPVSRLQESSAVGMCITAAGIYTEEQGNVRVMPADRKSSTDRLVDMIPQVLKCVEKLINTGIDCINKKCACADSEKKQNQKTNSNCGCGCTDGNSTENTDNRVSNTGSSGNSSGCGCTGGTEASV